MTEKFSISEELQNELEKHGRGEGYGFSGLTFLQKLMEQTHQQATGENYRDYLNWLFRILKEINHHERPDFPESAFFSLHDNIREKVIDSLRKAKGSLDICMFTISDDAISETIAGCHRMGIKVRIITDDGKIFDKGSDIFTLSKTGIDVKIDSHKSLMHHKFVIVDHAVLLTGSYNWTRTGADVNNENILITSNRNILKAYIEEFERLWKEMRSLSEITK
jgi:phosphatidylserine/phosphatidylglycerophosphate/cardiolipin synthase-like enzyme